MTTEKEIRRVLKKISTEYHSYLNSSWHKEPQSFDYWVTSMMPTLPIEEEKEKWGEPTLDEGEERKRYSQYKKWVEERPWLANEEEKEYYNDHNVVGYVAQQAIAPAMVKKEEDKQPYCEAMNSTSVGQHALKSNTITHLFRNNGQGRSALAQEEKEELRQEIYKLLRNTTLYDNQAYEVAEEILKLINK